MPRAIVTGAGGFLGRQLVPALCEAGFSVTAASSRMADELCALMGTDGSDRMLVVDNHELLESPDLFRDAVVLSCAFPRATDGMRMAEGLRFIDDLFAASVEGEARGVVNVSSQSVYSDIRERAAVESNALDVNTPYAVAKYATELLLEARCAGRVPFTSIRLASLIGTGFDQRVVNKMARAALQSGAIQVTSDAVFDFMDVRDAVLALVRVAESDPSSWQPVYNLGASQPRSLGAMAESVAAALQSNGFPCEVAVSAEEGSDQRNSSVDAGLFYAGFDWAPSFAFDDTVGDIVRSICAPQAQANLARSE